MSTTHQFQSWSAKLSVSGTAKEIAQALNASAWQRLSAGEGTKGARFYDWAYLELADLDTGKFYPGSDGLWTRGLLVRRSLADDKLAYFTTWCPAGTGADKLVQVEGCPWAIEDSFETAKNEFELDHNETRSRDPGTPVLIRWSVQEIRHIATRLAQRRIQAALVIAWSVWRRAHQAVAQRSQLKQKMQL